MGPADTDGRLLRGQQTRAAILRHAVDLASVAFAGAAHRGPARATDPARDPSGGVKGAVGAADCAYSAQRAASRSSTPKTSRVPVAR